MPMAVADAQPKQRLIVNAREMRCPRCKKKNDILRFKPLAQIEEFVEETNPIYLCPDCRWKFSPREHILDEMRAMEAIQSG